MNKLVLITVLNFSFVLISFCQVENIENKINVNNVNELRKSIQRSAEPNIDSIKFYCGILLLKAEPVSDETINLKSLYSTNSTIKAQIEILEKKLNSDYSFALLDTIYTIPLIFTYNINGYENCRNGSELINLIRSNNICGLTITKEVYIIKYSGTLPNGFKDYTIPNAE